jgi:glucose-1-phosphate thymidylyltransferase
MNYLLFLFFMKGVVLAGGTGSRLYPLTKVTNKHLLPVYDAPMIMHPLNTLKAAGIKEVMIVTGGDHIGDFHRVLKSGKDLGLQLRYAVQDEAGGIAQALGLTKGHADGESIAVILGDNCYETPQDLGGFTCGARIYLKEVDDPQRFGVARFDGNRLVEIIEKPQDPPSRFAVTGLYMYDSQVYDVIKTLKPSTRNELEITDVNNAYLAKGLLDYRFVEGQWTDAGTFESLYRASTLVRERKLNQSGKLS